MQAVATRKLLKPLAYLYYAPGLRQLCDWLYRSIAAAAFRCGSAMATYRVSTA